MFCCGEIQRARCCSSCLEIKDFLLPYLSVIVVSPLNYLINDQISRLSIMAYEPRLNETKRDQMVDDSDSDEIPILVE